MADGVRGGSTDSLLPLIASDDVSGVHYQRVKLDLGGDGLSVPVTGSLPVSQPGLSGGILQSVTTVGATAVPLPAAPLAGRAGMVVQNVGATTIYLGTSTVTADTTATGGMQLLPGQTSPSINISAAVVLYAISSAAGGLAMAFEAAA
jgi:hypothetical protein